MTNQDALFIATAQGLAALQMVERLAKCVQQADPQAFQDWAQAEGAALKATLANARAKGAGEAHSREAVFQAALEVQVGIFDGFRDSH